jgi:hypothetical protein
MRQFILLILLLSLAGTISAQDTFYVKKKPAVTVTNRAWTDSSNHDSLVSYTVEYQKPGSNLFIVLHEYGGRTFSIPWEATQNGNRILVRDIIRIDDNGRRYRQPDMYYAGGYWVPVKPAK